MIISISGIDGCGKTSIIEGIQGELDAASQKTRYVWLRYNHYLTKILLVICRVTGLTRYEYPDGIRVGYHDFYKSKLVSWLFIILTYLDTLFVSILLVYLPLLVPSRTLICDRWVLDIMIDLEIDTRIDFPAGGFLEKLFVSLMPENTRCFLIMREKEEVLQCRPENIRDEKFSRRWELYNEYSCRPWVMVVENRSTIEDAVAKVMRQIEDV